MSRPLLRIVNKTGPGRRFPRVVPTGLLAVMVLFSAAPSGAQPAVRQVLMLQSFDRGSFPVDQFTNNFRIELVRPRRSLSTSCRSWWGQQGLSARQNTWWSTT